MIFETECVHDVVQVYDGESTSAPLIGGINGSLSFPNNMFVQQTFPSVYNRSFSN